jgi:hypothetical protein
MINKQNSDVTFLIQGKYSPIHLKMIDNLSSLGTIILSCYKNDIVNINQNDINKYDLVILNEMVENPKQVGIYNNSNIYRQIHTTSAGLNHVETKFVVKLRTDAYYSNIPYILEIMRNNPDKYCTAPFGADPKYMFSFGDHIIAGTTDNIRNTFKIAYYFVETIDINNPSTYIYDNIHIRGSPEVLLTVANLKSKGIIINENYEKTVIDNYFMFDTGNLWPYHDMSNTINYTHSETDLERVRSIEEYIVKVKQLY